VVDRTSPPQKRANAGKQLLVGKRLHEVVVRARIQSADAVFGAIQGCEHQDRKLPSRAQPAAHADAVEAGQHHVQNHEVGRPLLRAPQCLHPIAGPGDLMAFGDQHSLERRRQPRVVLDDQDQGIGHAHGYIRVR